MALACTGSQCNFRSNGDRVGVADSAYVGCCSSGGAGSGRCRYAAVSKEKMGFFLICGGAAVSLVLNIILGGNIVSSVVSAVIMPLIIWLLIKNTWYEFH